MMTTAPQSLDLSSLKIRDYAAAADFDGFSCGDPEVDKHIPKCCSLHAEHIARTYCVFLNNKTPAVGFYALSLVAQDGQFLNTDITRGVTGYIVFIYLRYIGVQTEFQGNGIGRIMLSHCLRRSAQIAKYAGSFGVALNALNSRAAKLYYDYGFRAVDDKKFPFMVLPITTLFNDLAKVEAALGVT